MEDKIMSTQLICLTYTGVVHTQKGVYFKTKKIIPDWVKEHFVPKVNENRYWATFEAEYEETVTEKTAQLHMLKIKKFVKYGNHIE